MYWKNIHCLCTPVPVEQLPNTKERRMLPNTHKQGAQKRLTHVWHFAHLKVWQSWVKLTHRPPPPPRTSLCPRVWHACLGSLLLLPCSLIHLHVQMGECHVSAMTKHPTNKLRWEQLGSVVGTLHPSFLSLPGNRCCLREGPPTTRCLNEYQTKTLATRWVTRVNVGFSVVYYFSLSHLFFIDGWHAALHFGRAEKIKKGPRQRDQKNKQSKCGNCSLCLFSSSKSFYQY